jgi:site-specific recombinase XerD
MAGTRRKPGALGPHVDGYRSFLLAWGYTPETVRAQLKVVGQLGRWMTARTLTPADLNVAVIDRFLVDRRADHFRQVPHRRGLLLLVDHLVGEGVTPVDEPPTTALDALVEDYRQWLFHDRGLSATTVLRYENTARRFLRQHVATGDVAQIADLTGVTVNAFLLAESRRCSVGAAKGRVAELRSLLRFLHVRGRVPLPLGTAIPPVAGWHNTGIPPTLPAEVIGQLLDSCDRSSPTGSRDFAMLMLVARLGLRSIEVARLQLDDVDWRHGEVIVRGKARRRDRLPLPVDVGQAVAAYLADARPPISPRGLFVTCRAPRRPIRADLVGDVVERACRRRGIPTVGPHRLRHALATEMLASGVALTDISQVLRHRDLATTAIYAKVDFASLRAVARPWPGATR